MTKEPREIGDKAKLSSHAHNFPIVGIGASAGGLDAFKQLLEAIPVGSDMAYVVVQHLSPKHESHLTEILSRVTKIPILEITDEVEILPNHIYVMPSGKLLTSVDGVLKLTPRENVKTNLVIDIFFTSIAVVWESMAVGVVLSGTGTDGTLGLKMIKDHGGTTIVQDESADYDGMPQSAVDANVVDFVLPVEKIPGQLLKINNAYAITYKNGGEEPVLQDEGLFIKQILHLLHKRSGVDFTYYKQSTVERRIWRRMALHKRGNLADYLKFLQSDKDALDALFQDMLIPVTSFFRDPKLFETLTEKVLPALFKNKPVEDAIRFWIAGCATGEETYSIAICLHEFLGKTIPGKTINIFASDISEIAINKARAGIYSKADVQNISEERLSNYFTNTGVDYRVNKDIRDLCVFANHNFLKDPPFAKMDLISCRNVLIYMEPFLQKKALTTFHYALKENGTLLLGKSETASVASELFSYFDKQHKIYSRKPGTGRFMQVATGRREETLTTQNTEAKKEVLKTDFRDSANAILISKSPAAVIINEAMDIVHIHGDIAAFLNPSPGKPSFNLLKMAREGLAFELKNNISKVKTSKESVIKEEIPVNTNSIQTLVTIEIIPLTDMVEPYYLIVFTTIDLPAKEGILPPSSAGQGAALKLNEQLEKELRHTREEMRAITEEKDAANEELQSANEELQSSNEEMQSLNEELEASKEELQSSNEELISVNLELTDKQEQLDVALDYSEAIVSTIKEPLLVLDKKLHIKSANASFYKKFNLIESETKGRIFYELQNHQWDNDELRIQLENILPQKSRMEDFEMILDERTMLLNAREIISETNTEQLILLAIEDVTDSRMAKKLKESEAAQAKMAAYLKLATDSANVGTWSLNLQTQKLEWSAVHKKMWGYDEDRTDLTYEEWHKLILPEDKENAFEQIEEARINHSFYEAEYRINKAHDNVIRWMKSVGQYHYDDNGEANTLTGISIDITEQKESELKLKTSEEKYRGIFETMDQGFSIIEMIFDSDNKPVDCVYIETNPVFEKQTGLKNVTGKTARELIPNIEEHWFQIYGKVALTGEPSRFIEGSEALGRWFETYAFRLGDQGSNKVAVLFTDITEQKAAAEAIRESEMRFRTMAEATEVMIGVADEKSNVTYFNKAWVDLTGRPVEDLLKLGWADLLHPEDKDRVVNIYLSSFAKQEGYTVEFRILDKSGEYRWLLAKVPARFHPDGTFAGYISASVDITEQKSLTEELEEKVKSRTEELRAKNRQLENINAELASFSYVASHDLKEPLRKIQTFTRRIIEKENFSDNTLDYFNRIISSAERMQNLIDSLLNFSSVNSTALIFEPCDLNTLVEEAKNDLHISIIEKQVTIEHDNLPVIMGVGIQIFQLITNLLGNAIKYSRSGINPLIKITSSVIEGKIIKHTSANINTRYHEIKIADNGIGFKQEYANKIFEPFQRLHGKNEYSGTGIGLGIVKKTVINHNGFIVAEGKPGIGSTFTIYLPAT